MRGRTLGSFLRKPRLDHVALIRRRGADSRLVIHFFAALTNIPMAARSTRSELLIAFKTPDMAARFADADG